MMIEELLEKYKIVTKSIISEIERDVNTDSLFALREEVLKELFLNEDKEIVKKIYYSKGLDKIDEELKLKLENEQLKVKEELKKIQFRKNANNKYNANINTISYFNKKI